MFFTQRDADWLSECGGEVGDWCDAGVVGPSAWVDDSWWLGAFKLAGLSIRIDIYKITARKISFSYSFLASIRHFISHYVVADCDVVHVHTCHRRKC